MKRDTLRVGLIAAIFCLSASSLAVCQAPVKIGGQTLTWDGGTKYSPLPQVLITILRNGNLVGQEKSRDADARFDTEVGSGSPVELVFHFNEDYVPVVQGVAAGEGMKHDVSTALLTVTQYEEMRREFKGMPPVRERVTAALSLMRNLPNESPAKRDALKLLEKLNKNQ